MRIVRMCVYVFVFAFHALFCCSFHFFVVHFFFVIITRASCDACTLVDMRVCNYTLFLCFLHTVVELHSCPYNASDFFLSFVFYAHCWSRRAMARVKIGSSISFHTKKQCMEVTYSRNKNKQKKEGLVFATVNACVRNM